MQHSQLLFNLEIKQGFFFYAIFPVKKINVGKKNLNYEKIVI
jgi:hypothetical protein